MQAKVESAFFFFSPPPLCHGPTALPWEQIQKLAISCHSLVPITFLSHWGPREAFLDVPAAPLVMSSLQLELPQQSETFISVAHMLSTCGAPPHTGTHGLHPATAVA